MKKVSEIKNHFDAVLYFIQSLDIEMVDLLLDDTLTYQDMNKDIFVNKLDDLFIEFIEGGDTFLKTTIQLDTTNGFCGSAVCCFKCMGFSFVGNKSGNFIDLIFEIEEGKVIDIFECTYFKTKDILGVNERLELDKFLF
jgi:hypothetical protein